MHEKKDGKNVDTHIENTDATAAPVRSIRNDGDKEECIGADGVSDSITEVNAPSDDATGNNSTGGDATAGNEGSNTTDGDAGNDGSHGSAAGIKSVDMGRNNGAGVAAAGDASCDGKSNALNAHSDTARNGDTTTYEGPRNVESPVKGSNDTTRKEVVQEKNTIKDMKEEEDEPLRTMVSIGMNDIELRNVGIVSKTTKDIYIRTLATEGCAGLLFKNIKLLQVPGDQEEHIGSSWRHWDKELEDNNSAVLTQFPCHYSSPPPQIYSLRRHFGSRSIISGVVAAVTETLL